MSNFRADSELSRVNRLAGSEPVTVSGELFTVLDFALKVSRASHGAFDITVAPLLRALGFLPTLPEMLPSDFAPAESCAGRQSKAGGNPVLPDYRKVLLDPAAKTVRFAECGVAVDLGGIAKGYAVDRAVEALRRAGIRAARVSAGGSTIYALGTPPSQPAWRIGIRHPAKQEELLAVVPLKDASLSTSGSYEKSRIIHGQTYSHILDPRTGLSADNMLSSTVIAPSAMESDALSTATFVLGWEKAEDLLERRHRCGLFVTRRKEGAGVAVHGVPPAVQGCF